MSELPQGWTFAPLGTVCGPSQYGWTTKAAQREDGLKFLRTTDITRGPIDWNTVPYCDEDPKDPERYRLSSGDIVISRAGSVGMSAYLNHVEPAVFASYLIRFRPVEEMFGPYLGWFLKSPQYWRQVEAASSGITLSNLNAKKLSAIQVPIAPKEEQRRIVAAVEEQFSRLDGAAASVGRVLVLLRRMRAAVLQAAVTGGLVPQDPSDGSASDEVAGLGIAPRFTKGMKPPTLDHMTLPSNWITARVEDVAERVTVGFVGPMKSEYRADGVPFLRSQNVRPNRFDPKGLMYVSPEFHKRIIKSRLLPGDVVVVRSGSVGTACVVPDAVSEANCSDLVVVQGPIGVDPHFLAYYLNSLAQRDVRAGQVGVALTHFNTKSVAALPIPVPSLSEQRRIVAEADRQLSFVSRMEAMTTKMLERTIQLRGCILRDAFTGKLVGQDPSDEAASTLLERVASQDPSRSGAATPRSRSLRSPRNKVGAS